MNAEPASVKHTLAKRAPSRHAVAGCSRFCRVRRNLILAFLVLALAAVAAGCGGSDDETTTTETAATAEWADGLCTAISTWKSSLSSIASQFTDLSSLTEDGVRSAADDAKEATDTFRDDLEGLGTPDTESGDEIKSSVDDLSSTVETEVDSLETTVGDVSSLADVPTAVTAATASIEKMSTALSSTITTIKAADTQGEIKAAIDNSPDCASVTS